MFRGAGRALGLACVVAAGILDLTAVVVGGGVTRSWDLLEPALLDTLRTDPPVSGATTGYQRADAIAAWFIAALIVPRALLLLRDTARVLMEFAPPELDLEELREHLGGVAHVESVHDLHASTVATGLPVLTAHVVVGEECFHDGHSVEILESLRECVAAHFSVAHATFQLEPSGACRVEGQDDGCAA